MRLNFQFVFSFLISYENAIINRKFPILIPYSSVSNMPFVAGRIRKLVLLMFKN